MLKQKNLALENEDSWYEKAILSFNIKIKLKINVKDIIEIITLRFTIFSVLTLKILFQSKMFANIKNIQSKTMPINNRL